MKTKLCFLLLAVCLTAGCTRTARLYPVQGPLASQTPVPVLLAKVKIGSTSGAMSMVLSDGEICKGRWTQVPPAQVPKGSNTASLPANSMPAVWDAVYGSGFYVAHVLGSRLYAQASVSGNRGAVLNVEMYQPDRGGSATLPEIKGVAKDNKDNIYKVVL